MNRNNKPGRIVKGTAKQPTLKDASGIWSLDEAMQAHRANAWPQPNLFQPVGNSLRMSLAKASYLTKTSTPRDGSLMAGTFSFWMKPSTFYGLTANSAYQIYQTAYTGSSNWRSLISSTGGDYSQLYFAGYNGAGSLVAEIYPTWGLKDTNSWYHIVLSFDTTRSTNTDRFKMYVNGVQVTTFSSATYPAQNTQLGFFKSGLDRYLIGINRQLLNPYYDGYLAEFNAVDGYQLDPTFFGKFDSNNTWVPVAYTGTYGTNGFYLPFTNTQTSQTLGYDASLTGTTTYDADQDPYRGNVLLHLTGNGPAGGQNNTFADSSPNNFAITRGGTTTQGSFSPFPILSNTPYNPVVHGGSAYFGGSNNTDPLSIASNAITALPGDFTLEAWVYPTSIPNTYLGIAVAGVTDGIWFGHLATGFGLRRYGTSDVIQSSTAPIPNVWTHVAVTRAGSSTKLFINGALNTTVTDSTSYVQGALTIGGDGAPGSAPQRWPGYISNLRLIKGAAIYTAAFTPTMRPFGTLTNNLLTFSEDFASAGYWTQYNGTSITSGSTIAPDGTPSGWLWTSAAGAASFRGLFVTPTLSSSVYTFSVYLKYKGVQWVALDLGGSATFSSIDLLNGVTGTTASGRTTTINSVGNSWYRCTITSTSAISGGQEVGVWQLDANGGTTSVGSVTNGFYIWGAQLEAASSVGNYTPTPANFSTAPALLLNFANSAVVDTSGAGNITTVSNATITSASKYGSGALAFNGSSDYFQSSWSLNSFLSPGANNWTLETWVYMTKSLSSQQVIANYGYESGSTRSFVWYYNGDGTFRLAQSPDGSTNYDAGFGAPQGGFALNTWYHLAIVRNSGAMTMYVNGKAMPNTLSAYTISSISTGVFRVGSDGTNYFGGSMDDVRYTKGVARYTSDFAPPARALPETGGKSFATVNVNAGVVKSFTTTGTTSWTAPTDVTQIEVLVVAGGAGGGAYCGGGGGAGGLIYNNSYPVTPGQAYTVTVGGGGAGTGASASRGTNGSNSVFGNLIAIGGGGGASITAQGGLAGGSGGGDSHTGQTPGAGTAGQGFAGGRATPSAYDEAGGGGGGAGAVGIAAVGSASTSLTIAGIGGPGLAFGISGSSTFYAGGGAGGVMRGSARQLGGAGGGGNGAGNGTNATSGTANTGGGGGGGGRADLSPTASYSGGDGGSGIVIVRYTTTAVGNTSDATSDNLIDSPTLYGHDTGAGGEVVGNYATWNPLLGANNQAGGGSTIASSIVALSNGNLNASNPAAGGQAPRMQAHSNIGMTSGKWYAEFTGLSGRGAGISLGDYIPSAGAGSAVSNGLILSPTSGVVTPSTGASATVTGTQASISSTDVLGVAFDVDNRTCYYYRNGALVQTASSITTTLGTPYFSSEVWFFSSQPESSGSASAVIANFGQRAWAYTPPAGYNALTTKNFARPTGAAAAPNQYFDAILYTGNSSTQTISNLNFQPDLIWIKSRSNAYSHWIGDSVRGFGVRLYSDGTAAEGANPNGGVTAVSSTGFTVSAGAETNNTSNNYVAWCWRAGGAAVSNSSGTITSQVSANTTSGFSAVTYTGTGVNATVGHGLGVAPSMYICKRRNAIGNWRVYHTSLGYTTYINFDSGAAATDSSVWNSAPTSSVFGLGTNDMNTNTGTYVAYCWSEVAGFSKFGRFTGNGNADGQFVYCGFKPKFVMTKWIGTTAVGEDWFIHDTVRDPYNPSLKMIQVNGSGAEISNNNYAIDLLSNGFKIRCTNTYVNALLGNYIFVAFAEAPFGNVNGVAR